MSGFWLVSYVVLWVLFIGQTLLMIGVLQQLGVLQRTLGSWSSGAIISQGDTEPASPIPSAENDGPRLGSELPQALAQAADEYRTQAMAAENGEAGQHAATLVVCLKPLCEGCQALVAPLNRLIAAGVFPGRVVVLLGAAGPEQECEAFLSVFRINAPVVCDQRTAIMKELGVHRSPFAVLYGPDGRLIHKRETKTYDDLLALAREELPATPRAAGIVNH